jgi:hypothetical protein
VSLGLSVETDIKQTSVQGAMSREEEWVVREGFLEEVTFEL